MNTQTTVALVDRYPLLVRNDDNELGELVKELRENRGLSQDALGTKIGMSGAQISRIESGGGTKTETLDKIAAALQVDARMLHTAYAAGLGIRIIDIPTDDEDSKAIMGDLPYLTPEIRKGIRAQIAELAKIQRRLSIAAGDLERREGNDS